MLPKSTLMVSLPNALPLSGVGAARPPPVLYGAPESPAMLALFALRLWAKLSLPEPVTVTVPDCDPEVVGLNTTLKVQAIPGAREVVHPFCAITKSSVIDMAKASVLPVLLTVGRHSVPGAKRPGRSATSHHGQEGDEGESGAVDGLALGPKSVVGMDHPVLSS